jgi:hypothetical protein
MCVLIPVLASQSAQAAEVNCAEIENDLARLQCYDTINEQAADDSAPVITSEPVITNPTPTNPTAAAPENVVERIVYRDTPEDTPLPREIRSSIVRVIGNERKVYVLENGELWQEAKAYGLNIEAGSDVLLKKGWFRGYNMTAGRTTVRVAKVDD